jgi:hypothetical protein
MPVPLISVMAAKSDEGGRTQSEAASKSEGSRWETDLGACGCPPEAQHPSQDGNEVDQGEAPQAASSPFEALSRW